MDISMKIFSSHSLPTLIFTIILFCFKTNAIIQLPPNVSIPAVLVFGDSIMDTGNNNYITTLSRSNFAPYGKDFPGGIATGRFSNGKVPSDFIVEELGIKEYLPPYLNPNLKPDELITGVCFASGGAGYDHITSQLLFAISLSKQLDLFKEYIEKLNVYVGENRTNFILANSIFFLVMGSNDISNTYFLTHARQLKYDFPSYADLLVTLASNFTKEIYELGARRIGIFSVAPIGCVPLHRTLAGGKERSCVEKYNNATTLFNDKLFKEIGSLNQNLSNSKIVYFDVYTPLLDIIVNSQKYGFTVADQGCCGRGKLEVGILCNRFGRTCSNDTEYVFWDSFHPTEAIYKGFVAPLLQKYITQFF